MTLKIKVQGLLTKIPPPCQKCFVRYKSCGLKPESCSNTFYPISDKEIEFVLQTNENLPEDEMEIPVRNMLVMDIRERINPLNEIIRRYEEKKDQGIVVGVGTVIKWCKELQCKGMIWRH